MGEISLARGGGMVGEAAVIVTIGTVHIGWTLGSGAWSWWRNVFLVSRAVGTEPDVAYEVNDA